MLKSDYHELEGRHQRFVTDHLSRTLDSTGLGASLTAQDQRGKPIDLCDCKVPSVHVHTNTFSNMAKKDQVNLSHWQFVTCHCYSIVK